MPRLPHLLLALAAAAPLAACDIRIKRGGGAADSAATATRDSAAGTLPDDDISFPVDSAAANDVLVTPELRGDTTWRSAAQAYRGRLDSAGRAAAAGAETAPAPAMALPPMPGTPAGDSALLTLPIDPTRVNARPPGAAGASAAVGVPPTPGADPATALRAQVLLDVAGFSPGALDATSGGNTSKAAYFYQYANGLPVTGLVDDATLDHLARSAGGRQPVVQYTVAAQDVAGPYTRLPASPYEQAKLDCLCYESAWEQVAERFHTTKQLLARLNPQADTTRLAAGTTLWVPNVERPNVIPLVSSPQRANLANATSLAAAAQKAGTDASALRPALPLAGDSVAAAPGAVARDSAAGDVRAARAADTTQALVAQPQVTRIVISKQGAFLQALDAQGRIIAHMPSTLGASYDPSPDDGAYRVTRVVFYPTFHYNPKLYADVSDAKPDAMLPAGPNSAVGVVWMALSKPHYGIHGTQSPSTIGYADSHGCVRLTNWDVRWLAEHTAPGTPVEFVP